MSTSQTQDCIDSAGRLTAFLNEQLADCTVLDLLTWCVEANVCLSRDTTTAAEGLTQLTGVT